MKSIGERRKLEFLRLSSHPWYKRIIENLKPAEKRFAGQFIYDNADCTPQEWADRIRLLDSHTLNEILSLLKNPQGG